MKARAVPVGRNNAVLAVAIAFFLGAVLSYFLSGLPLISQHSIAGTSDTAETLPSFTEKFHLALTGCPRPQSGRIISTALLSAWLHDVEPHSVTVVWCHHYNASYEMLSLYKNLKHSTRFKVINVPDDVVESTTATYYTALRVPDILQQPDIPLIVVEEDVLFAPEFNKKLQIAVNNVRADAQGKPFLLSLYNPGLPGPLHQLLDVYNKQERQQFNFEIRHGNVAWGYGVQGHYFTPAMRALVTRFFSEVTSGARNVSGYQDMILHTYVYKEANCSQPGSSCEVYGVRPSLMEHIGATSGVFGTNNTRFHLSQDFMMKINFPSFDEDVAW